MKTTIDGKEIEIVFQTTYTRGIDKEFNKILFNGVKGNTNMAVEGVELEITNIQDANDYLVKAMTNLTEDQIAKLSIADYNKILEKIGELKIPS